MNHEKEHKWQHPVLSIYSNVSSFIAYMGCGQFIIIQHYGNNYTAKERRRDGCMILYSPRPSCLCSFS